MQVPRMTTRRWMILVAVMAAALASPWLRESPFVDAAILAVLIAVTALLTVGAAGLFLAVVVWPLLWALDWCLATYRFRD